MIHYFNPGHETAVLNASSYYMPPANVVSMQKELAYLPAWYACSNDIVLVYNDEDKLYFDYLSGYIEGLPRPVLESDLPACAAGEVRMWGISPQAIHYFDGINKKYATGLRLPAWKDEYTYLNSRQAARDCLLQIREAISRIEEATVPRFCTSLGEIEEALKQSPYKLLAKAPYSSSGRGLLWLPPGELPRSERQILHGILRKQGCVSVERVLDKHTDFAMEFMCDGKGKAVFAGYSLFTTNNKGGYTGNYIAPQEEIGRLITTEIGESFIDEVKGQLCTILSGTYALHYTGCVGVDMMIYKNGGEYRLHPCLEINMRYNMGYLSVQLGRYIADNRKASFFVDFNSSADGTYRLHTQMKDKYPVRFENGKVDSGYLPLCPVTQSSRYRAYLLVE